MKGLLNHGLLFVFEILKLLLIHVLLRLDKVTLLRPSTSTSCKARLLYCTSGGISDEESLDD
jgi:hypothetical protein